MREIKVVTDFLERAAENYPEKIGFIDGKSGTSFSVFKEKAYHIASRLIAEGVDKEPVAIYLPKCTDALISAFGIVYASGFYTF